MTQQRIDALRASLERIHMHRPLGGEFVNPSAEIYAIEAMASEALAADDAFSPPTTEGE